MCTALALVNPVRRLHRGSSMCKIMGAGKAGPKQTEKLHLDHFNRSHPWTSGHDLTSSTQKLWPKAGVSWRNSRPFLTTSNSTNPVQTKSACSSSAQLLLDVQLAGHPPGPS